MNIETMVHNNRYIANVLRQVIAFILVTVGTNAAWAQVADGMYYLNIQENASNYYLVCGENQYDNGILYPASAPTKQEWQITHTILGYTIFQTGKGYLCTTKGNDDVSLAQTTVNNENTTTYFSFVQAGSGRYYIKPVNDDNNAFLVNGLGTQYNPLKVLGYYNNNNKAQWAFEPSGAPNTPRYTISTATNNSGENTLFSGNKVIDWDQSAQAAWLTIPYATITANIGKTLTIAYNRTDVSNLDEAKRYHCLRFVNSDWSWNIEQPTDPNYGKWHFDLNYQCGVVEKVITQELIDNLNYKDLLLTGHGYEITSVAVCDLLMGTVTGGGLYDQNATATLTATAKDGFRFVRWSDGNTSNPRSVTVTADATYIAIFETATTMVYVGPLANTSRKINTITLQGTATPVQTVTCGENSSYIDKTDQYFYIREGETTTATFNPNVSWMHGYLYIDKDKNGSFAPYGIEANGAPSANSNLFSYSGYSTTGNKVDYTNSTGVTTRDDNPGLILPSFTAPAAAGIYLMRYKSDWNSIDPQGGAQFQSASGVAVDVMLHVVKEYNLTIVNSHKGATVTIDGATEASYSLSGTVLSVNPALAATDIVAEDTNGGTPVVTVNGNNITVTFVRCGYTAHIINGNADARIIYDGFEYADGGDVVLASNYALRDIRTNIDNQFVWGPFVDDVNKTIAFEVRTTATSITTGRWYQVQMRDKQGISWDGAEKNTMMAQEVSKWNMRYPGSQIYLIGANKTNSWTAELTGVPTSQNVYETFLYVPSGTALQMQNGGYISANSQYSASAADVPLVYLSASTSFKWNMNLVPWINLIDNKAALGQASRFANGYVELLFHPAITGEDYDIYKVLVTPDAEYVGSAQVRKVVVADATYIFAPKGTTFTRSDFRIDGATPSGVTTVLSADGSVMEMTINPYEFSFDEPHYFYNEEHGVFLSRGGSYGTQSVNDNIGIPYFITSKTTTKLKSIDYGNYGLGDNLYTDNRTPCDWHLEGDELSGYVMYYQNALIKHYLVAGEAHTASTSSLLLSNASRWKIIDRGTYESILADKVKENHNRVAATAGLIDFEALKGASFTAVDKTSAVQNAALAGNIAGWTQTRNENCSLSYTTNENGTEIYQGEQRYVGSLSQTVSGLKPGIYKVEVQGFFRNGSNAEDNSYYDLGFPISLMYLRANGEDGRFVNRLEEAGASQGYPNTMAEYKTMADAGKYNTEVYAYVGDNGKLDISINVPNYKSVSWAIFSNLRLTYYDHQVVTVHHASEIVSMDGDYILADDFNPGDTPIGTSEHPFMGTIDGQFNVIRGMRHPLFDRVKDATIKNVILEDIEVPFGNDIAGAIVNVASGHTVIYNCGVLATSARDVERDKPFVSSSKIQANTAGGIVGQMRDQTRVANCFSYADVDGGRAGGIVGDYVGTWYNGSNPTERLMVANCMVYGDIKGGSLGGRSPIVYGGTTISDTYSKYGYFRYKSITDISNMKQHGALAIQEDIWLDRFRFFQAGVTNHRDIAAYYIFGDASYINMMAQWYIDESVAPWPILRKAEKQQSVLNRVIPDTGNANEGNLITRVPDDIMSRYDKMPGINGMVSVTFNIDGSSYTRSIPVTDMDDSHYDYTWGKIVLPFVNEFDGWTRDYDYVCTGWEIASVSGAGMAATDIYNFSDRTTASKDIYNATTNPIIFAQGGNYIVPYGASAITVNAHFAKAYYLSDEYYDCAAGGANAHGGRRPSTYHGKTVYNNVASVWTAMETRNLPHDQAIVLVGNYHYSSNVSFNHTTKACTILSIDEDCDQQPDYGWYSNVGDVRQSWAPVRWDFVPIIGSGMLQMSSNLLPGLSIPASRGWFELSETTLCRTYEFEVNDAGMNATDLNGNNAYIIKGGWFQQLVRCYQGGTHNKLSYFNIGGNAYIKEFFHGNHSSTERGYSLVPVNVTGGEVESCFMTGQRNGSYVRPVDSSVRFYCAGGKIGKYLSVYMEYPVVNATMKVDHARIGRFFGGGTTPSAQLSGNIDVTMNYSDVDFFCGGPEFGDMSAGKTVIVNTTGSTFGEYYGAGFGGTALTRQRNGERINNNAQMSEIDNYPSVRLSYDSDKGGVGVSYEMECLLNGSGIKLFRFYDYYATLSLAKTGSVTTNAINCLFKNNFYGGGCQGMVDGDISSVLNNCTVMGNAYAGGYKASATEINVYPLSGGSYPTWDNTYKAFTSYGTYPQAEIYTWVSGTNGTVDSNNKTIATSVDMSRMGEVTGTTSLEVTGSSDVKGSVFGGGQESKVSGNTVVTINGGRFGADIFGGGEGVVDNGAVKVSADIGGNTTVNISGGEFLVTQSGNDEAPFTERHNIYAGGNMACVIGGSTYLNITKGMLSMNSDGSGDFLESGRGAMDLVYEQEGMMYFCAFGGGYGKNTSVLGDTYLDFNVTFDGSTDIKSIGLDDDLIDYQTVLDVAGGGFNGTVGGKTFVHVGGNAMCRNLYGGGLYATIGGNTYVDVTGGNIDNVYGGGVMGDILGTGGASTDPLRPQGDGSTNVTIGLHEDRNLGPVTYLKDNAKITILGSVYGGNDISGHVESTSIVHKGGTVNQNIYGAGNGDYRGYYTPNHCAFNDGENDNYILVVHDDGVAENSGRTYKGRPTTGNASIALVGSADDDKAVVMGQVFGGGNSCTVGQWDANLLNSAEYHGNEHLVSDNPAYFLGNGAVNITLGSHVKIGYSNAELAVAGADIRNLYVRDEENVSGLYMGSSGDHLATQSLNPADYTYHYYYDEFTKKYWPGFAVYANDGTTPLTRAQGERSFNAYLNNIMMWTDNVNLNVATGAEDIWIANFVGGGFRGSMKAKTADKKFRWTLPAGVTIGNCIIGGAFNTDVEYRIYDTTDGHNYKVENNHYVYKNTLDNEWTEGNEYHHVETDANGNIVGVIRFNYDGGILSSDGSIKDELIQLDLRNNMDGGNKARVFGGCFTSGTIMGGTNIDYRATSAYDVYGGGALANISGNTKVNLLGGSLTNAYGGGLGRAADATHTAVAALVHGDATVTLNGSKVNGSIFGCNNVNGTPLGHVKVHVLKTSHRDGQDVSEGHANLPNVVESYDVAAVYGGGNKAAYHPAETDPASPVAFSEVLIENCDNSIAYVYGGGNAASVPATKVTVYGANAIDNVFAGGNGAGQGNPGADIGYLDFYSQKGTEVTVYGMGTTEAHIHGGTIHNVYGGSNTLGYIRTKATVNVDEAISPNLAYAEQCPLNVGEIFVAGNEADMYCDGVLNIGCLEQDLSDVYGGANNANLKGNVTMNITNGNFENVFGGNNKGGNIYGSITINIDETGCKPINIQNLYCGGNEAAYSVYGYTDKNMPRDKAAFDALSDEAKVEAGFADMQPYAAPVVNIISFTSIGNIFGGGLGERARIYGDTNIRINPIPGKFAAMMDDNEQYGITKQFDVIDTEAKQYVGTNTGLIGNIYGGGSEAVVDGNTNIYIGTQATASHVTGSAELNAREIPVSVNITGNVYGGGNAGNVTGNTNVKIGNK